MHEIYTWVVSVGLASNQGQSVGQMAGHLGAPTDTHLGLAPTCVGDD